MATGDNVATGDNSNGNGASYSGKWQWFLSITTAVAIVVGALLTFFVQSSTLSTTVTIDSQRIQALEAEQHIQDTASAHMLADIAAMRSDLKEVETRFCSSDTVRNLMHAFDMRFFSMLWQRVNPDTKFPTDNSYYPQVCKAN